MNAHVSLALIFSVLVISETSLSMTKTRKLPKLLHALQTGRNHNIQEAQKKTIEALITDPYMPRKKVDCALDILSGGHHNRIPRIYDNITKIDAALNAFDITPGFRPLLIHCIASSFSNNPAISRWYQIIVALHIEQEILHEYVTSFGVPTDYQKALPACLAYNVITNKRWLACKTVDWAKKRIQENSKESRNLKKTITRQQRFVDDYNDATDTYLSYEIYSQHPITPLWQEWLDYHDVPYHELPISLPLPDSYNAVSTKR